MAGAWDRLIGRAAEQMRPFNDELIYGYKKKKIAKIPEYLDKMFYQVMAFFGGQMTYKGYHEMTPRERIDYIMDEQITKRYVSIRRAETKLIRFEFEFDSNPYFIYIEVPYLINERVVYNNTEYYPQFLIVEKGSVNRSSNGTITVKVMRMPMTFSRQPSGKCKLISTNGKILMDILVTAKVHQGKSSNKDSDQLPLILYHLCKFGFNQTMIKYGINPLDIQLSQTFDNNDPNYHYFMMPDGRRYLKVNKSIEDDFHKVRAVLSLYKIFTQMPEFSEHDAFSDSTSYYITVLGKYIGSKGTNLVKLLYPNAVKHLAMTDLMLDLVAKEQLRSVNCNCEDVYDLLFWIYFNIDDLLVSYDPTNLFDKKLESLDNLAAAIAEKITLAQYKIINSKKSTLDDKEVRRFCKKASQRPVWIGQNGTVFHANPQAYNDNFLLTIGLKRTQTDESITSSIRRKKKSSKNKSNPYNLRAHYSQIIVTSLLDIPSTNPVASGSMNPFVEIDGDGNIIRPSYADELVKVFK